MNNLLHRLFADLPQQTSVCAECPAARARTVPRPCRGGRTGAALTELVVAGGLLITASGLLATSAVAGKRLFRLEQHRRVAVDELSNQLERLTSLDESELGTALDELDLSPWAKRTLRGGELSGQLLDDVFGRRLELTINWERLGEAKPVTAVAWLTGIAPGPAGEVP